MNQPPPTETQTGKRIVSKGVFAAIRIGQGSMYASGMGLMAVSGICLLSSVACALHFLRCIGLLAKTLDKTLWVSIGLYGTAMCLLLGVAYLLGKSGYMTVTKAENLLDGIPLTRETADLPAPDSLVRASEQPNQEPQAVLLRAATESVETHEEQLVRPVHE